MSSKVFEMQGYLKLSVSEYDRAMGCQNRLQQLIKTKSLSPRPVHVTSWTGDLSAPAPRVPVCVNPQCP